MGYFVFEAGFDSLFVHVILHEYWVFFVVCVCCNVVEQSCGVGTRIQDIRSNVMEAF